MAGSSANKTRKAAKAVMKGRTTKKKTAWQTMKETLFGSSKRRNLIDKRIRDSGG